MSLNSCKLYAKIQVTEEIDGGADMMVSSFDDIDPINIPNGTTSGKADIKFGFTETVGTGGTTHDLNALVDSAGRTVNMVKVVALLVKAAEGNSGNVIVGNAASAQFQGPFDTATWTATLAAGAFIMFAAPAAGWSSASGAADKLKIAGSAAGQVYSVYLIGRSA